jgi:hypothetical protein
VIVLGFVVYEVSKIVAHSGKYRHVGAAHDRRWEPATLSTALNGRHALSFSAGNLPTSFAFQAAAGVQ